ncbi:NF-kappa-B essential modulator isoform X3 [Bactrocera dorsalis]|uniref:NF-kappa-B essential modulator isoform X3 n=1 Tax=Bactrocera dorsalis TaxID=27457 RepID=A0A6I9WCB0_BACDO|nr:NF-kappa-B essential modulator isoform X3 [Bactrocera dorsalis]XP_029404387.2 NF-kappa-B essential modulator isoform X3 [Bactrocera dorsalis]
MAEEESFVILGSCSQPNSLISVHDNATTQDDNKNTTLTQVNEPILNDEKFNSITTAIASASKPTQASDSNSGQFVGHGVWKRSIDSAKAMEASSQPGSYDVWQKSSIVAKDNGELQSDDTSVKGCTTTGTIPKTSGVEQKSETNTKESLTNSMAASIHSQFPSVSLEACEELTTVMSDYLKMKDVLIQVNSKMSSWLEMKKQMQSNEMENRQKLQQCQEEIAALRNENLNLKRELESKIEQIQACEAVRKQEHEEIVKNISEKSALIANMRTQIEKLELQQLSSFEVVSKLGKNGENSEKSEYVTRLEHERVTKNFERSMSQLLAEKLEINDMQKQYIDEINCLKANLTVSEELVNQLQSDIALLKANDKEKTAQFEIYATQRAEMREELDVLRQQVDVYSRDFQLERTAREEMAGEKAQLLDDLRALQRKNHELSELVGQLEERITALTRQRVSPPTTASRNYYLQNIATLTPPAPTTPQHICPICSITCSSLTTLQEHANQCIDRNVHT